MEKIRCMFFHDHIPHLLEEEKNVKIYFKCFVNTIISSLVHLKGIFEDFQLCVYHHYNHNMPEY